MGEKFIVGGPERFQHQKRGLTKAIRTGGVFALLFDPGLGKTATVLDYGSLLALKSPEREARLLVVSPLAAIDTWVLQAEKWVSPQVNVWAEALGGSITARAEALASRGGNPMVNEMIRWRVEDCDLAGVKFKHTDHPKDEERLQAYIEAERMKAIRAACRVLRHFQVDGGRYFNTLAKKTGMPREEIEKIYLRSKNWQVKGAPTAWGVENDFAWFARVERDRARPITPSEGIAGMGDERPRLVIMSVNLDTFSSRQKHGRGTKADLVLDAIKRYDPHLVIVDESHKIKGATSNSSRLLGRVGQNVNRRGILTGTVMPQSPLDVFGQWRFLEPFAFGEAQPDGSYTRATNDAFRRRFAVLGGYMGREVVGYRNLDEMHSIMARNAVVARKADALDLPPLTEVIVPVNLSANEQKAYEEMKKNLALQFTQQGITAVGGTGAGVVTSTTGNRLTQLMRLRQITSGHLPDDLGNVHELGTSKVDVIDSIVNDSLIGEDRVVIFSVFTHEILALERKLARKGTEIMVINGQTPKDTRIAMRKRFGSAEKARFVLVAQVKTISLSVNELVTASNAVFGSLSQQRDDLIQAIDRLNRIGQTKPMTIWHAIAPKTVDEVILKSHADRTDLESAMLRHIFEGEN